MATVQEQIDAFKKTLAGLDEFEKERLVSQFVSRSPKEIEPPVKSPPPPGPRVGLPSLGINLPGVGESLRPGNESGILSIGTPGTEFNELGSGSELGRNLGLDLGSGFRGGIFNLQEAIRDQARAEEEAARDAPRARDAFLESLKEERDYSALKTGANIASGGITTAKLAGMSIHPALVLGQLLNTFGNMLGQNQQDKLIRGASGIGTLGRAILPNFLERLVPGLTPTVPTAPKPTIGLSPFHPTPQQSEQLINLVTLPRKKQSVQIETLDPPSDDLFSSNFGFSPEEMREDFSGIV
jgi:hypothetical protein